MKESGVKLRRILNKIIQTNEKELILNIKIKKYEHNII